jgi:hypothetical protein
MLAALRKLPALPPVRFCVYGAAARSDSTPSANNTTKILSYVIAHTDQS